MPPLLISSFRYTGKERDSESGNDYFEARYYGSNTGRFLSPDPIAGSLANPQLLNRYVYALNNPLILTDPTGMIVDWEDSQKGKDGKPAIGWKELLRMWECAAGPRNDRRIKSAALRGGLSQRHVQLTVTPTTTGANNRLAGLTYSAAGNVTYDGQNSYAYDAEGRLCAVAVKINGVTSYTQYLYDAEGRRVGKWGASNLACGAPTSSFTSGRQYLLGLGGEQVTELSVSGSTATPVHSNFWVGGTMATYDLPSGGLHFALTDPLGTKRAQVTGSGQPELDCLSWPFGNDFGNTLQPNCVAATGATSTVDATEHHFTGKERDTESANDYFEARYYSSAMGRFLSPDWSAKAEPIPYAKLDDPQSLNLYSYVKNNPLTRVDVNGHVDWWIQRTWNWFQGKGFKTDAQIQGLSVAQTAHSNLGSTDWIVATGGNSGHQVFKPGSDKCNENVGDTLDQSGHQAPMVPDGKGGMRLATAHELADPNVHINGLSDTKPLSEAAPGDVIAQAHGDTDAHAKIIVAPGVTSSANANQGGVVTENDWGFRDPNAAVNNGERNGSNSPAPVVRTPIDKPHQ